ncbi:nascent polypeptide-associated complex subunit alpha-like protein 2 [Silene latifolia]|uniref:nascent polypeptide-associated complex subunit alpha-like protein 2 n=1 Tax=Silene latifolia TaxID=37657 RepID=UPI003D7856E5
MSSRIVVEQEQKQIPAMDVNKCLAQGSENEFRQSKSVEEICSVKDVPQSTLAFVRRTGNEMVYAFVRKPYVFKTETNVTSEAANNVTKEEEEDEEVDETGVDDRDIELVMEQVGVCRSKAVKALKAFDGDLVYAIVELTSQ